MVLKILMCCFYKEEFLENVYEYKKKIIHFHCKCGDEHPSHFVLFCKDTLMVLILVFSHHEMRAPSVRNVMIINTVPSALQLDIR